MTRSVNPPIPPNPPNPPIPQTPVPTDEVPHSAVHELQALYHEGSGDEPSPLLDRSILEAARAALRTGRATKSGRRASWWKRWLPATSAIAVTVLALSLTVRVVDEQERASRMEMNSVHRQGEIADKALRQVVPEAGPAGVPPSITEQIPTTKRQGVESKPARNLPAVVPEQTVKKSLSTAPQALAPQQVGAGNEAGPTPSAAPAPVTEAPTNNSRVDAAEPQEKRDTREAIRAGSRLATPPGKLEGARRGSDAAADAASSTASKPADEAATPEAWVKHIRQLQASGRVAEAAQSLARLRVRYPDFVLPDDLNTSR